MTSSRARTLSRETIMGLWVANCCRSIRLSEIFSLFFHSGFDKFFELPSTCYQFIWSATSFWWQNHNFSARRMMIKNIKKCHKDHLFLIRKEMWIISQGQKYKERIYNLMHKYLFNIFNVCMTSRFIGGGFFLLDFLTWIMFLRASVFVRISPQPSSSCGCVARARM